MFYNKPTYLIIGKNHYAIGLPHHMLPGSLHQFNSLMYKSIYSLLLLTALLLLIALLQLIVFALAIIIYNFGLEIKTYTPKISGGKTGVTASKC